MGKGSKRRPQQVPDKVVEDNWDRIFKKERDSDKPLGRTGFQIAYENAKPELTVVLGAGKIWREKHTSK